MAWSVRQRPFAAAPLRGFRLWMASRLALPSNTVWAQSILVVALCAHNCASAWDGDVSGPILQIDSVPAAGNFDFRVYLNQSGPWCGTGSAAGWAGLHSTDPNFKSVQATVMLAFAMGKAVRLLLIREASGYCKIGYVIVTG